MKSLIMTFDAWLRYTVPPGELLLNVSPVDGSDFIQPMPIGISVFATSYLPNDPGELKFTPCKTNICSAMFQTGGRRQNPHRVQAYGEIKLKRWISPQHVDQGGNRIDGDVYMRQLLSDKFTISPRGHGVDCHRNYEAILCKCIPLIVGADEHMKWKYRTLPVIFLTSYRDLSQNALPARWRQKQNEEFDFAPMFRSYWKRVRPDIDIDAQANHWLKHYKRTRVAHYLQCPMQDH